MTRQRERERGKERLTSGIPAQKQIGRIIECLVGERRNEFCNYYFPRWEYIRDLLGGQWLVSSAHASQTLVPKRKRRRRCRRARYLVSGVIGLLANGQSEGD